MKRTVYQTRYYVLSLICGICLLTVFIYLYGHHLRECYLTLPQELALSISILGTLGQITMDSYRYIRQYSLGFLKRNYPILYHVNSNLTAITIISICYVEASLLKEGGFYWFFIVTGWLFIFVLFTNIALIIVNWRLKLFI